MNGYSETFRKHDLAHKFLKLKIYLSSMGTALSKAQEIVKGQPDLVMGRLWQRDSVKITQVLTLLKGRG